MGEKILSKTTRNNTEVLDLSGLAAGVYIVNIINKNKTVSRKITITR